MLCVTSVSPSFLSPGVKEGGVSTAAGKFLGVAFFRRSQFWFCRVGTAVEGLGNNVRGFEGVGVGQVIVGETREPACDGVMSGECLMACPGPFLTMSSNAASSIPAEEGADTAGCWKVSSTRLGGGVGGSDVSGLGARAAAVAGDGPTMVSSGR